jgi:hypothetical protein
MRRKNIGRTFITIIIIVLLAYAIIDSINKSIWQYEKQESDLESKIEQEKEKTEEELSIGNSPPIAIAGEDMIIEAGSTIILSAYRSTDPDGDELIYNWDLGDERIAEGIMVQVQYPDPGEYIITLTVSDSLEESKDSFKLTVTEPISKAPAIKLEIIEGPFLETGFCVYRVRAYVSGDPPPKLYFNRDDGLPANDNIAQVNLKKEENEFTLIASAENKVGKTVKIITLKNTCH